MSLAEAIAAEQPASVPKGWEPYAEQVGQIGSAVVRLPKPNATRRDLIVAAGFDPDEWSIKGDVQVRRWMRHDQEWLYYYKYDLEAGVESDEQRSVDVDALVKSIRKPRKATPARTGDDAWVFVASDWQIGKGEGDGTPGTVSRVLAAVDAAKARIKDLRRVGRAMPHGVFAGTGDIVEGCTGFYPNQAFLIDCNRREQAKVARRLIAHAVDELAPLFDRFTVATVGGNHGENRSNGGKTTDDADNDDVAVFECVREAFDRAGRTELEWIIPHDELSIMLRLGGLDVGFTHGHLFSKGSSPQQKAIAWWQGQDFGFQAVRGARVLVSSHFHSFSSTPAGNGRTHMQSPAMDPGSKWFTDSSGKSDPAGVLTFRVDASRPLGWDDLSILGGAA